jgi:hypothetical protein
LFEIRLLLAIATTQRKRPIFLRRGNDSVQRGSMTGVLGGMTRVLGGNEREATALLAKGCGTAAEM